MVVSNYGPRKVSIKPITAEGITFWNAMYIPIVIAMAAKQNVFAAISSGWLAICAGFLAVALSFLMIPILVRFSDKTDEKV